MSQSLKKILILGSIVIMTIAATIALIRYVKMDSFPFAWALNFMLMFFVVFFTETLQSTFSSSYYDEKDWERKGKIYENFGINIFRKLLVWIGWEKVIRKGNPIEKNTESLRKLHHQTKKSEFDHLIILVIALGFNVFVAIKFGILKSLWLLILNVFLHIYPIFLQRYNRPRIARAIKISDSRVQIK